MNIGVAIERSARRGPDATAVFAADRRLTYAQLDERTARLANVLRDHFDLRRGDRVALLVHNRIEVVEVLGGCAKAGLIYCGLNFRLAEPEYESIFENAEPRLIITEPEYAELASRLTQRSDVPVLQLDDPGPDGYEALLALASPAQPQTLHEVRPEDDFCIVYTSVQHAAIAIIEYELTADSRWLMALPHNSSLQITLLPLLTIGGAIGFSDSRGFDAERFTEEVRRQRATHTYLVPTMLFRLLEAGVDGDAVPTLQTIGYGAAPIPPERVRELLDRFGPIFTQLYGMAEVASIGTMLRKTDHALALAGQDRILASCGRPSYAMDVRVVDDEGRDVEPGRRGEVIFGSAYTMKGYYRDPQRTAEALVDGWMRSGDIGEWDQDGFLYIVDRKKDLIIRGGLNIIPSEVENVLYRHPGVLEAAVVGVPDPEWGEALLAVVALKRDADATAVELIAWCRQQGLASIMVPQRIEFLASLPKNAVGKIAKRELRDAVGSEAPGA